MMTTKTEQTLIGARPTHPGRVLRRELEAREMTQAELAARLNRPAQVVSDIVKEKKAVTAETADGLEIVLGMPAHMWLNLQSNFELTRRRLLERRRLEEVADQHQATLKALNLHELIKRGWLEGRESRGEQLREVLSFFGSQSLEAVERTPVAAALRITPGARVEPWSLAAWMRRGELEAAEVEVLPYSESGFRDALREICGLTTIDPSQFWPRMQKLCGDAGVVLLGVPHLPKTGANGVSCWRSPQVAMIQLNLKYSWADIFWFTFFHEAAHVLRHDTKRVFVDLQGHQPDSAVEREADDFARDILIPMSDWTEFVAARNFRAASVTAFASSQGIHPGIVVGRLQHEKHLRRNQLNQLRTRLKFATSD